MPTLVRLSVTPVKALRLSHPEAVELTTGGIPADRRFYLIDEDGGLFDATDHGPLLRVVPDYDADAERLSLSFPDGSTAEGPVGELGADVTTDFFGRDVDGRIVEGPLATALSAYAGRPVRLVRVRRDGEGQDVHPLTIVSSESVRDLGDRDDRPDLDARRFRINLEIEGLGPYEEDTWEGGLVRVGDATIEVRGQIPRCVVTTLAPDTGEKDFPTLTRIARYRPRIGGRGGLPFGMYAGIAVPGRVRVGDPVELLSSATTPAVDPSRAPTTPAT
ncbi:MAG TPA: MOSC domain-containing protein [Actinomycetota bacterium]|nr:MOSC domain-containing protein [Actinomycetota bacterium]